MHYLKKTKHTISFLVCVFAIISVSYAQSYILDKSYNNLPWNDFVIKAEQNFPLHFFFRKNDFSNIVILVEADSTSLQNVLKNNLNQLDFFATIDASGNVFISKEQPIKASLPYSFFENQEAKKEEEQEKAKNKNDLYLQYDNTLPAKDIYVGDKKKGAYKEEAVVSGYVFNRNNNSIAVGAMLFIEELKKVATTDNSGAYSFTLKKGNYSLKVRGPESEEDKYKIHVYSDGSADFYLREKISTLSEVTITAESNNNVERPAMGIEKISTKSIKYIPKMMGETDIVKTTLLLPGVQAVGEGTAGFNVRGSPADQNVFFVNQIPIYNTSHLLGFFSAFTPNAISDLTLYKSSFPAQFGGRLSSIFDLTAKQGSKQKFFMQAGISPITADVLAEGPIQKEKSSYMIGIRSTYSNWILKAFEFPQKIKDSRAGFNDAIANLSFMLNQKNKLNLSAYYSTDDIKLYSLTKYDYQNLGSALKWSHFIKNKHNLEVSGVYSKYSYYEENSSALNAYYKINYALEHVEAKTNFTYIPNEKHKINIGANSILYLLDQGNYKPLGDSSVIAPVKMGREQGLESGIFINDEWKISPSLSISGGVRYNSYTYLGPKDTYVYANGQPLEINNIIDSIQYKEGEKIKTYSNPDLRLSAKYSITDKMSVKAAFNQVHQYLFLLSNTIALSPTDKWKLVDNHIKPMSGEQYSVGFFSNLQQAKYELSAELYYKDIHNLVEYKDGANLLVNAVPETDILQGNLKSYGIEFMLKKTRGKFNGWINYTYSRAIVQVTGETEEEKINFGNPYSANYDKPHALNLVTNYKFSHRFNFSANVIYATGRPIIFPAATYYLNGTPIIHYSARNEYRIPNYFRIDLSFNLEGNLKAKKFAHGSWSFSVYNLLGRDNPYSIYFKQEKDKINGYRLSIFGSPILSLSYNLKLGNYDN